MLRKAALEICDFCKAYCWSPIPINKQKPVKILRNKNLLLLKCETAGHGGKTGRDNAISELAEEFAFILKSAGIKK